MAYYLPTDWELKDFYRNNVDSLYCSCRFLTCGEADAEAMVKAVFLKLLKNGMIFSNDKDGKAWLLLTAFSLSKKPPVAPAAPEEPSAEDVPPGEIPMTEAAAENEDAASAEAADLPEPVPSVIDKTTVSREPFPDELKKLSRRDRLIVLMYYCEGFRKSEIAGYLGCTTFMVNSRLKRIRKRILQEKGGELDA